MEHKALMLANKMHNTENLAAMKYVIGCKFLDMVEVEINKYLEAAENENIDYVRSHTLSCKYSVANALAGVHGITPGTIIKYGNYAAALDNIYEKNEIIATEILEGKTHMSYKSLLSVSENL